jgi:hypothetical protein
MATDATLRDTLVSETAPEVKPIEKVEEKPAVNMDAAEIGQILLDSGYSKDQLNALMEAPKALAAIRNQIETDPTEFVKMLQRTDPALGNRFLETVSDTWLEQNKHLADKGKDSGKPSGDAQTNELMREMQALREKVTASETREQRREAQIALASATQRYDSRVDELLNQKDIQELKLTKAETKAIRARLGAELSRDPNAVQRVSSGNFADVPRTLKGILDEWSDDRKQTKKPESVPKGAASRNLSLVPMNSSSLPRLRPRVGTRLKMLLPKPWNAQRDNSRTTRCQHSI